MVHFDAILYAILICGEIFENNEANWCIPTLLQTYARRLWGRGQWQFNESTEEQVADMLLTSYIYEGVLNMLF